MNARLILMLAMWLPTVFFGQYLHFTIPIYAEQTTTLTCLAIALPLLGTMITSRLSLVAVPLVWYCMQVDSFLPLTMGIPTFLATLSWRASRTNSWTSVLLHVIFPPLAMVLFTLKQPEAWVYTLYWLIPVAGAFFPNTLLTRAFQSTFVAHAAGSLMWVYLVPLSATQWVSLLPLVAVERLLAVGVGLSLLYLFSQVEKQVIHFAGQYLPISDS